MTASEIEAWARDVIERVVGGAQAELSLVELKSGWEPDHQKIARRIAGMLNAARLQSALLIVGVDEKAHRVSGAVATDYAAWWVGVQKQFDSSPPTAHEHGFSYLPGQPVVAIQFDTDAAPYVVKTETPGGPFSHEVPWRDGSRIRSALRGDLLKILMPQRRMPRFEFMSGKLAVQADNVTVEAILRFWAEPPAGQAFYIRRDQIRGTFRCASGPVGAFSVGYVTERPYIAGPDPYPLTQPHYIDIRLTGKIESHISGSDTTMNVAITLPLSFGDSLILPASLPPEKPQTQEVLRWGSGELGKQT